MLAHLDDVNQGCVDFLTICPSIMQVIKHTVVIIDTKRFVKYLSNLIHVYCCS